MTFSNTSAADSNVTLTTNSLANGNPTLAEQKAAGLEDGDVEKKVADVEVNSTSSKDAEDVTTVHWDSDDDPQDPMNWSPFMKWLTIALISLSSFNVYVVLGETGLCGEKRMLTLY